MPRERLATKLRRRGLGLLFLGVVAGFVAVSILQYNQAFTTVVMVTLKTDHTGNQLLPQSDVKVRGIIVGQVRGISADGDGATVKLALEPDKVDLIPDNVSAQLLPKTLFGERYVALEIPDQKGPAIKGGDVIAQDRSSAAIETQQVLSDLMPVLEALQPAEVNSTLNAISTALSGRGTELGQNISLLNRYLTGLNPHTSDLVTDLVNLGKVSQEYNGVAPDLLSTLSNLKTTSATVVSKAVQLDQLLSTGTSTSNVLNSFLSGNVSRIIQVSSTSATNLKLLAEYTPEYECMLAGLAKSETNFENVFRDGRLHITLEVVKSRGKYVQGDQPKILTGIGPQCYGLPNPAQPFQPPSNLNDGAALVGGASSGAMADVLRASYSKQGLDQQGVGTPAETSMIDTLIAGSLHTPPDKVPGIASVLAAPMLRGSVVTLK